MTDAATVLDHLVRAVDAERLGAYGVHVLVARTKPATGGGATTA